jgi:hypothetical protein
VELFTALAFLLLVLAIGIIGWASWHLVFSFRTEPAKKPYFMLLSGMAAASAVLFAAGVFGWFRPWILVGIFFLVLFLYLLRLFAGQERFPLASFLRYAALLLLFGCACLAGFSLIRPFDAAMGAQDASAFIATSHSTVRHGGVRYEDELASRMTSTEKDAFFYTSYVHPAKSIKIRLTGGFMLFDTPPPDVTVGFFHLFPLWLALGNLFLGDQGFLLIMTMLSLLNVATLFLLGSALGGRLLGTALALLSALFLPQLYYFLLPMSEVLLELLLLAGIVVFMQGAERRGQLLTGTLWGAALLTKLEVLVFLPLCLALVFAATPLRKQIRQWKVLIMTVAFCYLLTVHYHIDNGGYFYQIFNWCKDIPVLNGIFAFLEEGPGQRAVVFFLLWVLLARAFRWPRLDLIMAAVALGIFSLFFIVYIKQRLDPDRTLLTLEWFGFYMDRWVLFALLAGLVSAFLFRPRPWIVYAFFLVPAVIYLIDPMIHGYHPFAIRRFVPLFFPLLFALACKGWLHLFARRPIRLAGCGLLFGAMAVSFAADSALLLKEPLFRDLTAPLKAAVEKLPSDALVLVSRDLTKTALHMPVQFAAGRDTLVQEVTSFEETSDVQNAFIERQLAKRKVYLILERSAAPPKVVNGRFDMAFTGRFSISFFHIEQREEFTGTVEKAEYEFLIFELGEKRETDLIDIGDPALDLPHLRGGFHGPERSGKTTYRWTDGHALVAVPPVPRLQIAVSGPQAETFLHIQLNGIPVGSVDRLSTDTVRIDVTVPDSLKNDDELLLSLESGTFNPGGADVRELGIKLFEIKRLD